MFYSMKIMYYKFGWLIFENMNNFNSLTSEQLVDITSANALLKYSFLKKLRYRNLTERIGYSLSVFHHFPATSTRLVDHSEAQN